MPSAPRRSPRARSQPHAAGASAVEASALIDVLERGLSALPAPLEPLDISGLDGYLCGVLLRAKPLGVQAWGPGVLDVDARAAPAGLDVSHLLQAAGKRLAELDAAIAARRWFDPWVFEVDDPTVSALQLVQPWVSGFTLALERFPGGPTAQQEAAREPLAVLYGMFDPQDLDDVEELLPLIETLEPARTLDEAVEDLVRCVLLLADVVRPLGPRWK